ncbi:MAG: NAD-dependent epimerase/dehydratase family protein [Deltaproteobacteria bacterium]|nr:NAD-dependent epimerase/dehydratase family protein [Deltaproteobacteria bacterium]
MNDPSPNPLAEDLDDILSHTRDLWEELRDQRIFITGGTGFFGCWLLESFAWANDKLHLNAEALVLTRNYESFLKKAPHLATHPAVKFHIGDVRDFEFPEGHFPFVIHAATEASAKLNIENPLLMWDTIIEGTSHTLEFSRHAGTKKFLLTSSGAVYGKQPPEMTHIPEEYKSAPDPTDPNSAYGEGKRAAEMLCTMYAKMYGIQTKIARCFAFVGPYLPLDIHYAIGNFIRDGLQGGPVQIKGDGTPYRSYLYAADLAIWLWTILFRGEPCRSYNVGSDRDVTIKQLADIVANIFEPARTIEIHKKPIAGQAPERYVPSIQRVSDMLNLAVHADLKDAIERTKEWHKQGHQYE